MKWIKILKEFIKWILIIFSSCGVSVYIFWEQLITVKIILIYPIVFFIILIGIFWFIQWKKIKKIKNIHLKKIEEIEKKYNEKKYRCNLIREWRKMIININKKVRLPTKFGVFYFLEEEPLFYELKPYLSKETSESLEYAVFSNAIVLDKKDTVYYISRSESKKIKNSVTISRQETTLHPILELVSRDITHLEKEWKLI